MPQPVDSNQYGGPFVLDQGGDLTLLRRACEAAEYTFASIGSALFLNEGGVPMAVPASLRRTTGGTQLDTLLRLFLLAQPAPAEAARAAVAPAKLDDLLALGLLQPCPEGVRAQAALMPQDDLLLAREFWPEVTGRPMGRDYVLGVGRSSQIVARLTVRRREESALDLGTGSGYLALLAARHARRVLATDVNPRALNFAALNARLNGLTNVEFRQGSLFEPVADQRFDLIVANPPFVISPQADYVYRDSGLQGDALCERIVRQAPAMLREGGYCTLLFNWHHKTAEDWAERPAAWLVSSGCDAWLTNFDVISPLTYAATWLTAEHKHEPEVFGRLIDQWVAYLESLGVGKISFGALVMRRRSGADHWLRAEHGPAGEPTQACSEQIERVFAAEEFLRGVGESHGGTDLVPDERLLRHAFVLTPHHRLEQVLHAVDNRWVVEGATLKQTRGYPFVGNVDRLVSMVLAGCDGKHPLGRLCAEIAAEVGAEPGPFAAGSCSVVRTLLRWGFLTPAAES
jgi:methylase of polypeptide subunit release factors